MNSDIVLVELIKSKIDDQTIRFDIRCAYEELLDEYKKALECYTTVSTTSQ